MISNGEKVAIVGHNGSGKTTLLKTISNIYSPTKGEITVVGKSFSLKRAIYMMFVCKCNLKPNY